MQRLIVLVGPTAVGKTRLSIDLALRLRTEIISGDSMLVYQGLDIGTAKPTLAERRGVPHHLIDILQPAADYSVAEFQLQAARITEKINSQGKIPFLAGGTGLYVKALLEGYRFNRAAGNEKMRLEWLRTAAAAGNQALHNQLAAIDPAAAARLHPNDLKRVIRALEVHHCTGEQVSQQKEGSDPSLLYDAAVIGLSMNRQHLYQRIHERIDAMMAQGLVDEVAGLLNRGISASCQSMQGIGYKEIVAHLAGQCSLAEATDNIRKATRHFAKRQLTWYRKMPYIHWFDVEESSYENLVEIIYSFIAGRFHLR